MIGPSLFTQTFAYFIAPQNTAHLPGAPFLLASSLLLVGMGLSWRVTSPRPEAAASASPAV
jgi:DHA1 family tetracycline resistance protein-like MFS transporter